ncbi:MAG TPA: hypothetical protein VE398_04165 [Acidobacteriota bacterium]|nr:hypothetical protein [Acidobacteriota bacterium]
MGDRLSAMFSFATVRDITRKREDFGAILNILIELSAYPNHERT